MPELLADADSRKDRWHPSPQLTKVLEPFGDTRSSDGLESSDVTVNIRIEAVMVKI